LVVEKWSEQTENYTKRAAEDAGDYRSPSRLLTKKEPKNFPVGGEGAKGKLAY